MKNFYQALYQSLQGGQRGLSVPQPPLEELARALTASRRALVLTGFPIDCGDHVVGETDGPCGAAEIVRVLTALGCQVTVVTDGPSLPLLRAALDQTAPETPLEEVPMEGTEAFVQALWDRIQPDLFLTIERPGKAANGHFHNMRGTVIDAMTADTDCLLALAAERGCVTVAIGDGGNELGMGALLPEIAAGVPHGAEIGAVLPAQYTLAAGVSNWWGPGLAALLSHETGRNLMLTQAEDQALLQAVVDAGAVDGCTKERTLSVDGYPVTVQLELRRRLEELLGQ